MALARNLEDPHMRCCQDWFHYGESTDDYLTKWIIILVRDAMMTYISAKKSLIAVYTCYFDLTAESHYVNIDFLFTFYSNHFLNLSLQ